jgi:2-polyprenyl-3-methyl-5-hydroxy-6-metoxy-1,4-benzoquinol methylase
MSNTQTLDGDKVGALCGRLFNSAIEMTEIATMYFGTELGIYDALRDKGPITASKLAAELGLSQRYLSEWLGQQAIAGFIDAEEGTNADDRRYSISPEHAHVFTEKSSPEYFGFAGKMFEAVGRVMPALLEGFRTGNGVPFPAYGPNGVATQTAFTYPGYVSSLVQDWVPQIPGLTEKLSSGARVAELACGSGVAAVQLAKAFPTVTIDGYDLDETSIAEARRTAEEAGVADRVTFRVADARDPKLAGSYDAVLVFEAIHDMGDPIAPLRTVRRLLAPGGVAVVADEKVQDTFTAPGDEVERFMAAASVVWCLPQGLSDGPDAHGTLLRAPEFTAYAKKAGWSGVDILPIDHESWRFYRLVA